MMKTILRAGLTFFLKNIVGTQRTIGLLHLQLDAPILNVIRQQYGYELSASLKAPVDGHGKPIPWYTYPATEFLQQLDLHASTVFEWGSGNSSLFFAERAGRVISIENDPTWFERIDRQKKPNQTIELVALGSYVSIIEKFQQKFDIIVIDGQLRPECGKIAASYLKEGGMVILDNSDWFTDIARTLREQDLIEIDFHGFGPINEYSWTTSVFLHRKYNFQPIQHLQPMKPLGGIDAKPGKPSR